MTISLPRGMRDIDSKEMSVRLWIYEKIKEIIKRYGFQLVEPSAIEYLETLQAQAGEDIKNEIFWFKDKAGRDIGLRFDLTVGMTRMAASDATSIQPIKIACISNMWRYDEPQFARYRCFYQWDLEIYGSKEVEADLEVISVGIDVLEALGLKEFEVRISNRNNF
jgi:histidyl-tRNA synthetase